MAKKTIIEKRLTTVTVTHITSPYLFYVQEASTEFTEFEKALQKYYTSLLIMPLKNPRVGQMCVAKYSEDNGL